MVELVLRKRLLIRCQVDNTQAIAAVSKGYTKKLRCLSRTQRVSIGVIHEMISDPEMQIVVEHCATAIMKGDMFTKALAAPAYIYQREAIGMMQETAGGESRKST